MENVIAGNFYDKYASHNPLVRFLMKGFFRALSECLSSCGEVSSLLEVGCGEGEIIERLPRLLPSCNLRVGLDISEAMTGEAQRLNPAALVLAAAAERLPFTDHRFDLVIGCEVLEHLVNPDEALAEMVRVGGRHFIFSVPREPLWSCLNLMRGRYLTKWGNTPGHLQRWSSDEFRKFIGHRLRLVKVVQPLPWTFIYARQPG